MRFYVDYENVGSNGLKGIEKLNENDILRIYYSNDPNINMETVRNIINSKAKIQFWKMSDDIKSMNMKNALDIIILTDISRQLEKLSYDCFAVVSCDSGYDVVLSGLSDDSNCYLRCASIDDFYKTVQSKIKSKKENKKSALPDESIDGINNLFENELSKYASDKSAIISVITKSKSRCEINNGMLKFFDSKKTGVIMKAIKPFIKSLPGQ